MYPLWLDAPRHHPYYQHYPHYPGLTVWQNWALRNLNSGRFQGPWGTGGFSVDVLWCARLRSRGVPPVAMRGEGWPLEMREAGRASVYIARASFFLQLDSCMESDQSYPEQKHSAHQRSPSSTMFYWLLLHDTVVHTPVHTHVHTPLLTGFNLYLRWAACW